MKLPSRIALLSTGLALLACAQPSFAAVNSYRFLHVTINTPWNLFLFLLMGVLAPFVLMAVLLWRNAMRRDPRPGNEKAGKDDSSSAGGS